MVLIAGAFVDVLHDDSETGVVIGTIVSAIVSFVLSLSIANVTRLPITATFNLLGLAALANVLVHVISDGGESEILGIPPGLIESAILSALPFAAAWLYVSRKHGRSLVDLGFIKTTGSSAYGMAVGAWVVAYIGLILWGLLIQNIESLAPPDNTSATLEIAGGSLVLAWLLAGLWGPAVEEIFFRGFLLGGLRHRVGQWPALLISSGVFAVFHIEPGLYVPTFLLGAAFGWVYLKTRSIWPSIFIHTAHNTLALVLVWQDSN
jgi:membrane protease YdiL (CAAX protease family)